MVGYKEHSLLQGIHVRDDKQKPVPTTSDSFFQSGLFPTTSPIKNQRVQYITAKMQYIQTTELNDVLIIISFAQKNYYSFFPTSQLKVLTKEPEPDVRWGTMLDRGPARQRFETESFLIM